MQGANDTLLRLEIGGMHDFELIEGSIRDHLIPVTLCSTECGCEGIQPSFLMMNREYLKMKMTITRWLRSKDFIVEDGFDLPNDLCVRYFTFYSDTESAMLLEIRSRHLLVEEDGKLTGACKRKSSDEEEVDGAGPDFS